MPHFVIDCSENVLQTVPAATIIQEVYDTANATGLFRSGDIKVRINPYTMYTVGGTSSDFIHVFGHIMQGRNTEQKKDLSTRIVTQLKHLFPAVSVISMNVSDFEKATYCNRTMVP